MSVSIGPPRRLVTLRGDLNQGAAHHGLATSSLRRLARLRRRAVPLAAGLKIGPVDLSGSFQLQSHFVGTKTYVLS